MVFSTAGLSQLGSALLGGEKRDWLPQHSPICSETCSCRWCSPPNQHLQSCQKGLERLITEIWHLQELLDYINPHRGANDNSFERIWRFFCSVRMLKMSHTNENGVLNICSRTTLSFIIKTIKHKVTLQSYLDVFKNCSQLSFNYKFCSFCPPQKKKVSELWAG